MQKMPIPFGNSLTGSSLIFQHENEAKHGGHAIQVHPYIKKKHTHTQQKATSHGLLSPEPQQQHY